MSAEASRLRSADEYRRSLADDRSVFYRGERVPAVEDHLVLSHAVDHAAVDFELASDPAYRDLAVTEDGYCRYFAVPRTTADLLARSRLVEEGTRAGKTLVPLVREIGTDALLALLTLGPAIGDPYAARIKAFHEYARDGDLALCVAQTDVKGDRSLPPSEQPNPDAYLRVVIRSDDGIVVRGAKAHTSVAVNSNEMIVLPTRALGEREAAYAVAFALPVNTPGLTMVASPFMSSAGKHAGDHPISAGRKMVESTTLFDDVFVPRERVFLDGQWEHAGALARGFVEFHRFTATSYKLPLLDALVGSAFAAAAVNGLERVGHVRDKLSWLVAYGETVRALTAQAAHMCSVRNGIAIPDALIVNIAKLHFAQGLHTAFQYVQDIAGGLLATYPADEDFDHPTYGVKLERYFAAGGNTGGRERLRLLRMISDLTTGDYGGYQTILAIHAEGSIEAEKLTILSHAKRDAYIAYARWLAGLDDSRWPPRSDNAGAAFGDLS